MRNFVPKTAQEKNDLRHLFSKKYVIELLWEKNEGMDKNIWYAIWYRKVEELFSFLPKLASPKWSKTPTMRNKKASFWEVPP